jgi:hypothetical protein
MRDFERTISLRLRTDRSRVSGDRLADIVAGIDLRDERGRKITDGYDVDVANDLVVGFSGGTAEIVKTRETPAGLVVSNLFKNERGEIVQPDKEAIATYTIAGERLCSEQQAAEAAAPAIPMTFAILLDRSGSMESVIDDVRAAALGFIDDLPNTATCAVGAFSSSWSFREEGLGVRKCVAGNFDLSGLRAGGKTYLFPSLGATYSWLGLPDRADHQKAVIIITDGQVSEDRSKAEEVAALKQDVLTFVYFLGERDDAWLKGLADNYLAHRGQLREQLERYFGVLSEAYAKQTVLRVNKCPPAGAGNDGR